MRDNIYVTLIVLLAPLSLASIGGATGIYAPLQHETVETFGWLTTREFVDLFAISRLTPGPSSMLAPLIAWKVAGVTGALVALIALYLPSSLLCYGVARVWEKYRGKPWHRACEAGLTPVAAGLVFSGVAALLRIAGSGPLTWFTLILTAGLLTWRPKLHPFWLLGCGALAFFLIRSFVG
jgi:chromate transporter